MEELIAQADSPGVMIVVAALLVLWTVLKEIIVPIVHKMLGTPDADDTLADMGKLIQAQNQLLEGLLKQMSDIERISAELHNWHAPEPDGTQGWKGGRIEREVQSMNASIIESTATMKEFTREVTSLSRQFAIFLAKKENE